MFYIRVLLISVLSVFLFSCASPGAGTKAGGPESTGLGLQPGFYGEGELSEQQLLAKRAVFFDFNKTTVKKQYIPLIETHAAYLTKNSNQVVLLAGNTDARGSREYNMGLGERRAQSVADLLLSNGVKASQIIKISYGPEVPIACTQNETAYAQNRRVDILYCKSSNCKQMAKSYAHKMCSISN